MGEAKRQNSTVECTRCGHEMWDDEHGRKEMNIHEDECDCTDDPRARFDRGDRVIFSRLGLERLNRTQSEGIIIGFAQDERCVRVQWDDLETPMVLNHRFVKHVEEL